MDRAVEGRAGGATAQGCQACRERPAPWLRFRRALGQHDVQPHRTARKRLGNRVVEGIEQPGDALDPTGDGLTMIACSA